MVIFRFATGSSDIVFDGLVNSFVVAWNPSSSRRSDRPMTTSLSRNGETEEKGEAGNGRKSGATASRQAWEPQENKTRTACGLRRLIGLFAERSFFNKVSR